MVSIVCVTESASVDSLAAEWTFCYFQYQCQKRRTAAIRPAVEEEHWYDAPSSPNREIANEDGYGTAPEGSTVANEVFVSFRAKWQGKLGRLFIDAAGVGFVGTIHRRELWKLAFNEIKEILKIKSSQDRSSKLSGSYSAHELELISRSGITYSMDFVKDRDQAFNYIIGFSTVQWKTLQIVPQVKP